MYEFEEHEGVAFGKVVDSTVNQIQKVSDSSSTGENASINLQMRRRKLGTFTAVSMEQISCSFPQEDCNQRHLATTTQSEVQVRKTKRNQTMVLPDDKATDQIRDAHNHRWYCQKPRLQRCSTACIGGCPENCRTLCERIKAKQQIMRRRSEASLHSLDTHIFSTSSFGDDEPVRTDAMDRKAKRESKATQSRNLLQVLREKFANLTRLNKSGTNLPRKVLPGLLESDCPADSSAYEDPRIEKENGDAKLKESAEANLRRRKRAVAETEIKPSTASSPTKVTEERDSIAVHRPKCNLPTEMQVAERESKETYYNEPKFSAVSNRFDFGDCSDADVGDSASGVFFAVL